MKITKLGHSCLLVEMPEPEARTALFDPGTLSEVDVDSLQFLDDIIITHGHSDHFDLELVKQLAQKFPDVHITAPSDVVELLNKESIAATSAASQGLEFFNSPHEGIRPLFDSDPPEELGVHYLGLLSHPGDSYSFQESKEILALPVQGPWGSTVEAVRLGLKLRPTYIIPVHDWHWSDEARAKVYRMLEQVFEQAGITFVEAVNGEPFVLDV
jgi:L-ascorbate metabolism protein UlaG (beta-lactamase superfamily)